ncbi:MAG TPA: hypothetical protein VFN25_06330 [Dokdonella sp.]|uniref:hypothetical protein n=1 Tax=Dokdonella sp. TaxID=2291710 RepID=UPI002D8039D1|nr:hypothetical protein [Dokdonella sp.]HET9032505.1 hypothetical protein [Dokdonella sp.]
MAISILSVAKDARQAAQDQAAMQKYNEQLIDALLAKGTPRAIALAATSLSYADRGSRPAIDERRLELLDRAAQMAPDDAWVQWLAVAGATPSGSLSEPLLALQRLAPDNGAIWLFQLRRATQAKDNSGINEALHRIGASSHFDDYFTTNATEWLKFLRDYPLPETYAIADKAMTERMVLISANSRAAATYLPGAFSAISVCKPKSEPLTADRRAACLAAGRLMLNQSSSLSSMAAGAAVLRAAQAADTDDITRNQKYFTEEYAIAANEAIANPDEIESYVSDWIQTRNEVQFARNLLTRAGIPLLPPADWKPDPQRFHSRITARNSD